MILNYLSSIQSIYDLLPAAKIIEDHAGNEESNGGISQHPAGYQNDI